MTPASVKAAVFDVGNTLWFEAAPPAPGVVERVQAPIVRALLREWGIAPLEPIEDALREMWGAFMEALEIEEQRRTFREPSLPFIIRGALAARGVEITVAQSEQWWRATWIPIRLHSRYELYPDVLDVLIELKSLGVKIGLNTVRPCTSEMFRADLIDFGLLPYVDAIVTSGDTGFIKPHRSTFDLVLARLGVDAGEAVMVGDTCKADVAGAKAVGMRTVWKLNGRYDVPPCSGADYTIHDLGELLTLPLFGVTPHPVAAESLTPYDDENADRY